MNRQMNPITPEQGLHCVKRSFQKKFMGEQCEALVRALDVAIERTRALAPVRERPYLVKRAVGTITQGPESRLERQLFDYWAPPTTRAFWAWDVLLGFQ